MNTCDNEIDFTLTLFECFIGISRNGMIAFRCGPLLRMIYYKETNTIYTNTEFWDPDYFYNNREIATFLKKMISLHLCIKNVYVSFNHVFGKYIYEN
jgi:hypothetical protein